MSEQWGRKWRITIKTDGEIWAGTGSKISIVVGQRPDPTREDRINSFACSLPNISFVRDSLNSFLVEMDFQTSSPEAWKHEQLTGIDFIELTIEYGWAVTAPAWKVDYVVLVDLEHGNVWQADFNCWIDGPFGTQTGGPAHSKSADAKFVLKANAANEIVVDLADASAIYNVMPWDKDAEQQRWTTNPRNTSPGDKKTLMFWGWRERGIGTQALSTDVQDGTHLVLGGDTSSKNFLAYVNTDRKHAAEIPVYEHSCTSRTKRGERRYAYSFGRQSFGKYGPGTLVFYAVPATIDITPHGDLAQKKPVFENTYDVVSRYAQDFNDLWKTQAATEAARGFIRLCSEIGALAPFGQARFVTTGLAGEFDFEYVALGTEKGDVWTLEAGELGACVADFYTVGGGFTLGVGAQAIKTVGFWFVDDVERLAGWAVCLSAGFTLGPGLTFTLVWALPAKSDADMPIGFVLSTTTGPSIEVGISVTGSYTLMRVGPERRLVG